MEVLEYVRTVDLGPVRGHNNMEALAKALIKLKATSPDTAVTAASITHELGIEKKTVYNRLSKPGFVKVVSGPGTTAAFYYLYNDRFGDLARVQGHDYYPDNLGPLALYADIPKMVEHNFVRRLGIPDIVGSFKDITFDRPTTVATPIVADNVVHKMHIDPDSHKTILEQVNYTLVNPLINKQTLHNLIVQLVGLARWVEKYEQADPEKQLYIRNTVFSNEASNN